MTLETHEVLENLCYYDKRNPNNIAYDVLNNNHCYCDNCFKGKTQLAEKILKLTEEFEQYKKESIKWNIEDLFNKSEQTKTWELDIDKVHHIETFKQYDILPSLMFIIDKQMADYYEDINEEPYISYYLIFQWLNFYIELTYNKKV